jgi:hypothetical protein
MINGILVTRLKKIHNPKGDFFEAMNTRPDGYSCFGEVYFSIIHYAENMFNATENQATLYEAIRLNQSRFWAGQ